VNAVFLVMIAMAFAVAAGRTLFDGGGGDTMAALARAAVDGAGDAVKVAIGLIGVLALFLGMMRVGEKAGLLDAVARLLRPLLVRLFPDVPANHPAMGAMIFNIAANVLGLGNAATPFGLRAMQHLHALNRLRRETDTDTATNAMVLFLAINTASVTLLPTTVIALRAAAGSRDPAAVVPTTLFATVFATATAIIVAKFAARLWRATPGTGDAGEARVDPLPDAAAEISVPPSPDRPLTAGLIAVGTIVLLIALSIGFGEQFAAWIIPSLIFGLLTYGALRRVPIYREFVDGARDGFDLAVRILPYLVAILVAVSMLRASGAIDRVIVPLGQLTTPLGLPPEGLIMAILRALSGSGAFAYLAAVINDPAIGPDSYTGLLVSTIQASTETTFYVIAVYFGSIGVTRFRHAIVAGLAADVVGVIAAVIICRLLYV
jgi:spore maturation protein SpmA